MKGYLVLAVCCVFWGSCSVPPKENTAKGVVLDATMNTITIVANGGDTLSFSTLNADRATDHGLLIGDSVEVVYVGKYKSGMEASRLVAMSARREDADAGSDGWPAAAYVWSGLWQDSVCLFVEGVRTEAVDGSGRSVYVLFAADSSRVELFDLGKERPETLERRVLPAGGYAWNVEDDATMNLRYSDGRWTISQRGRLLFSQQKGDNEGALGQWVVSRYEGVLSAADSGEVRWQLWLRHREHSGDGSFLLVRTCLDADGGQEVTSVLTGRRNTLRGIPADNEAVVWQLVPDGGKRVFNFLCDTGGGLTLLNDAFEKDGGKLNCMSNRID